MAGFTPDAQAHADEAATALHVGDYDRAQQHLDHIFDHGTPGDRAVLAVIVAATQAQRHA